MTKKIHVLYVDDEPDLLLIGKLYLEKTGYFSVTTLDSASAALVLLNTESFDAIISDYQMPVTDGLEFLKQVRLNHGEIPFILFTGRGREEVVILALNSGADFYLQKGGDPKPQFAELSHKILNAVQKREAEAALRESEEKFRVLAESSPVAIVVFQGNRDVYVNEYTSFISGYSKEELRSKTFWDFIHPDSRDLIKKNGLSRLKGGRGTVRYEIKYITKSNETKWADLSAGNIFYDGKPAGIAMLVDITERKRAEEELQAAYEQLAASEEELRKQYDIIFENQTRLEKSEADYRSILENIQDVYYRTDKEGNLILASPSLKKVLDYPSVSELYGLDIAKTFYYNPEDRESVLTHIQKEGSVTNREIIFKKRDGTLVTVLASSHSYYDNDGNYLGIEGIFRDITERKLAEVAIQESENLYRSIFDLTGSGTIIIDDDTTIILANEGFSQLSGFSIEELEGKKRWTEFVVPEDLKRMNQYHHDRRDEPTSAPRVYEFRFVNRYGEIRYCINNVGVIPGTTHSIASVVDISERVVAEQALKESENLYRAIFDLTGSGTIIIDIDTTIILANQGFAHLSGFSIEELERKKKWTEFVVPEDLQWMTEYHHDRRDDPTHAPRVYELRFINRYGEIRHCINNVGVIPGTNYSIASLVDITERIQTDTDLKESEEKFRALVEESLDGVIITDLSGKLLFANRTATKIFGYEPQKDPAGTVNVLDFITPEFREKAFRDILQVVAGIDGFLVQYKALTLEKEEIWIECIGKKISYEKTPALLLSIRDFTGRRKTEEALFESEERYRNVVEDQTELICRFLPDGTHTFVNEAYCRFINKNREDIIGTKFSLKVPREERILVQNHFTTLNWENPHAIITHRIIMPDGSIRWQRWSDRAIFNDQREIIEFQSVGFDITELKQAEEKFLKSESIFKQLEEQLPDYIIIHDGDIISFVNAEGARLMDKTPGQIIGTSMLSYVAPEYHDLIKKNIMLRHTGAFVEPYEIVIYGPSGDPRWVVVRATPIPNQDKPTMLTVLTDISIRKNAEEALKESEVKYRSIIENMQDLFYRTDLQGTITMVSPGGIRLAGFKSPEEVIGHNVISEIYADPKERELFIAALSDKGEVNNFPLSLKGGDGSLHYVTASSHFYYDKHGNKLGVEGILHDVTERVKVEEELVKTNRKLSLLSSITRHDINNQLTVLKGYLEILKDEQPDLAFNEYYEKAITAAEHIASMIQFTGEYENIGVQARAWQDVKALVYSAAEETELGYLLLKNDIPACIEIFADPLIVKVLYNLMDNAVRYSGKKPIIRFSLHESGDNQVIVCEDDGCGVPSSEKEKIFERGYGKNTGLGLALSREILNSTGITLKETGEPGVGARFEITVPKGMWRSAEKST